MSGAGVAVSAPDVAMVRGKVEEHLPVRAGDGISLTERRVRKLFQETRLLAEELKKAEDSAKLRKRWTREQQKLVDLYRTEKGYGLLQHLLPQIGTFYRTGDGLLFFLRYADHKLYEVEEKTFERYLTLITNSVQGVRREWLPKLQAWVRFEVAEVVTQFLAYNDSPDLNVIAVSTFDGFMMRRKRGGAWERVENGTDGILFWSPEEFLTPWGPDFANGGDGQNLEWLCRLGSFGEDGPLSADGQRGLLYTWLLHLFVPGLNPTHPIPLHEGVTDSGKTTLGKCLGRWLMGPTFDVLDLPSGDTRKAEETLTLAVWKRPLVILDNVDSPAPWLEDFLCRLATGVRMSRRRLYTNTEEVHFTPRAGLIITSRNPHFRREDVARRLLPLRFQPILSEERLSEAELRREVETRRAGIWADMLAALARLQDAWPRVRDRLKPSHSMADFSIFGALLAAAYAEDSAPTEWEGLMERLEQAQGRFSTEADPLTELLAVVLDEGEGVIPSQPVRNLFRQLAALAKDRRHPWPYQTTGSLSHTLKAREEALEQALGAKIVWSDHHAGEKRIIITRLNRQDASQCAPHATCTVRGDDGDGGEATFPVENLEGGA